MPDPAAVAESTVPVTTSNAMGGLDAIEDNIPVNYPAGDQEGKAKVRRMSAECFFL